MSDKTSQFSICDKQKHIDVVNNTVIIIFMKLLKEYAFVTKYSLMQLKFSGRFLQKQRACLWVPQSVRF